MTYLKPYGCVYLIDIKIALKEQCLLYSRNGNSYNKKKLKEMLTTVRIKVNKVLYMVECIGECRQVRGQVGEKIRE